MDDKKLSEHFYLSEFLQSQSATRLGIDNEPTDKIVESLIRVAFTLEQVRKIIAAPIIITSGYRCQELNKAIGGVYNSAHISGLAADFISPVSGTPLQICRHLSTYMDTLQLDQLIFEQSWVHIGLCETPPRKQILTYNPGVGYAVGLPK